MFWRIFPLGGIPRAFLAQAGRGTCSLSKKSHTRETCNLPGESSLSGGSYREAYSTGGRELVGGMRGFLRAEPPLSRERLMSIVIRAKKNNTFLHLATPQGGLVYTTTAKNSGAKGTGRSVIKEGTNLAVNRLARRIRRFFSVEEDEFIERIKKKHQITRELLNRGFHVRISGLGAGRFPAIFELSRMDLNFDRLTEETKLKHGGNRSRKPRRV